MPNIVIKLMVPIVFFALMVPSAYGISLGVTNNGQSSNLNVQAGTSDSVSASFSVDGTSLSTLFAASGLKRFNHTYTYTDPSNNVATLWVDVVNGKGTKLSVSPVTGKAEGSETLSVTSADKIDTGAIARTSEGDTAIVALNVISGSLTGYTNYANANLISDTGEKTFVARQSASAISGSSITATSQAAYAAGESAQSSLTVTKGLISNFQGYAGKYAESREWTDYWGNYSDAWEELYASQYAGTISGSSVAATSQTSNAAGLESDSRLKVTDGKILGYQNNASIYADLYSWNRTKIGQGFGLLGQGHLETRINAYNIGKIPAAPTKGRKTPPPPPDIKLAANASSTDGNGNATDVTTSIVGGTITDYFIGTYADLNKYIENTSDDANITGDHKSISVSQHAQYINSTTDFKTYLAATGANGNTADLATSMLKGSINGYESNARTQSDVNFEIYSDGGNYSSHYAGPDVYQYTNSINADSIKTNSSATDALNGRTADMRTSVLGGTIDNYENEAYVDSYGSLYKSASGDNQSESYNDTEAWHSADVINASDFKTHLSATEASGNATDLATSVLDGKIYGYYSYGQVYNNDRLNFASDNVESDNTRYTETQQYISNINASDFKTNASVSDADGNSADVTTSVLDGTIDYYNNWANVYLHRYDDKNSDGSAYFDVDNDTSAGQYMDFMEAADLETNASFSDVGVPSADMATSVLNGELHGYDSRAGVDKESYGSTYSDGSGYVQSYDQRGTVQYANFMNASAFNTSMSMTDASGNSANLAASSLNATIDGYESFAGVDLERHVEFGSGGVYTDSIMFRGARQNAYGIIANDFKTNASITDANGNFAEMTTSVLNGKLEDYNGGAVLFHQESVDNYSDNSNYSETYDGMGAGQSADDINASDFYTNASITDADGNSAEMTASALDGDLEYYGNYAQMLSVRYEATNPDGSIADSWSEIQNVAMQYSDDYYDHRAYINANDFATTSTAFGITGSEATVSMHLTDASILNFNSQALFNTGSGDEVEVEAFSYADEVVGSLINASGSSHDQHGNASSSTMDLVPKTGATSASISEYGQESRVTYPGYYWDFNGSISWIRGDAATGDAAFTATATNSTTTKTLDPTPYRTTLDGTSFVDFGRVKEGTAVAYFASPDPDININPWDK